MSAQVEAVSQPVVEQRGIVAAVVGFFETLVGLVMVALIVVGLVALTLTWRSSDVEFMSDGKLRVTQYTWWGLQEDATVIYASPSDGWTIERPNGDKVPMKTQAIRLRN
jgi:hypothetical protein